MAETCAIDFSYSTYYSSSIVLEGLRGPLLSVLTWSCPDLENCCNCSSVRYGGGLLAFFSYLVGETQQWTWLLQWIVLCDPALQRCCLRRRPISRQPIVVVADHKWNDEPLRRMADHARQFRLDLLFFEFLPSLNARGRKSRKARVLNFGTLAEGEMFCWNSLTA